MSQIKQKKFINLNTLKINRISLLNQSDLNISLQKLYLPQKKIDMVKELLINNKYKDKLFDLFFTPFQNINSNIKTKDNNYKINPLSEKNKIVKKHNILQKIDFNVNSLKHYFKRNKKCKLFLSNNNNLNLYNNYRPKITINRTNKETINIPLLTHTNREQNQIFNITKNDDINFYKNKKKSSSNNKLSPINSCPSLELLDTVKKYNNIFTNEKIHKIYAKKNIKIIKPKYIDEKIQTNNSYIINKENNKKKSKIKNKEINIDEYKDESSSDNIDDIKEIENIISKSNLNIYSQNNCQNEYYLRNKNNYYSRNKIKNENINNYILLKSLYRDKDYNIKQNYNHIYEQSKTSRNLFLKGNSLRKKKDTINRINFYSDKNKIINWNNISRENKEISERKNMNKRNILMPYIYKNNSNYIRGLSNMHNSSMN